MSGSEIAPFVATVLRDKVMADVAAEQEELRTENERLRRENERLLDTVMCDSGRSNDITLMGPGGSPVHGKGHLPERGVRVFSDDKDTLRHCHTHIVKPSERYDGVPTGDKESGECPTSEFLKVKIRKGDELVARVREPTSGWSIGEGNSYFEMHGENCYVELCFSGCYERNESTVLVGLEHANARSSAAEAQGDRCGDAVQ